jgi:hypothetical protein
LSLPSPFISRSRALPLSDPFFGNRMRNKNEAFPRFAEAGFGQHEADSVKAISGA